MSQRKRVRLHHQPGEHILSEFDADTHASFADLVMRETVKQQPHEIEDVTAVLGAGIYPDAGLKYLRTHTQPHSTAITSSWIDRTLAIAHAPEYRKWRSYAINNLVPWQEPMRFADERIDALLFAMARENLPSDASSAKVQKGSDFDTIDAVRALAWRDRVEIFPAVMTALRLPRDKIELAKDDLLAAAALLASRHAEFRPEILSYVAAQLTDLARSDHSIWALLNTVWRFEYHEVAALLQNLATASVDEVEDRPGSDSITRGTRRFHDARRILVSWNEPHPLTKLKLNALIEASVWNYGPPPELLRRQFESLAASEQAAFRTFIEWMKGQKLPFNWQPERAEWAISPEALAAAR